MIGLLLQCEITLSWVRTARSDIPLGSKRVAPEAAAFVIER